MHAHIYPLMRLGTIEKWKERERENERKIFAEHRNNTEPTEIHNRIVCVGGNAKNDGKW